MSCADSAEAGMGKFWDCTFPSILHVREIPEFVPHGAANDPVVCCGMVVFLVLALLVSVPWAEVVGQLADRSLMMTAHEGQSADPRPIEANTEEKTHTAIHNSESEIDTALVDPAFEFLLFFTSLSSLSSMLRLF